MNTSMNEGMVSEDQVLICAKSIPSSSQTFIFFILVTAVTII